MKKLSFTFFILFVIFLLPNIPVFSQENWEDPIAITDSVSDNINPILVHSGNTTLIFYEKTGLDDFSSIYMQDINNLHQEIELFSEDGINFRNPQAIVFDNYPNQTDTMFYLFFESDMASSTYYNIYYTKYSQDGNFTVPVALDISYTSCEHLRICANNLVWERGGNIEYCFLNYENAFSEFQTLDYGDCHNPEVGNESLAYQKLVNDSLKVYFTNYSYEAQDWNEPESIYNHSIDASIVMLNSDVEDFGEYGIIWETQIDNNYQLISYENWVEECDTLDYFSINQMQTTALSYEITLKDNKFPYFTDLALVQYVNGNKEIFADSPFNKDNLINISNSDYDEAYPKLQYYAQGNVSNVILFWQSTRNNHQQLFMTKRTFWMNIADLPQGHSLISVYPNPTSSQISIEFNGQINQKISVDLYDINGSFVSRMFEGNINENKTKKLQLSPALSNGIYFLKINNQDTYEIKKIIISK